MRKLIVLAIMVWATGSALWAQDDELPPPSSKPRTEQPAGPDDEFRGFTTKKKVDLSKFIIEPNFNFSIGAGRIDAGLSPYVGYRVWEPPKRKGTGQGLYVGGGLTYFYTGFRQIPVTFNNIPIGTLNANFHTFGGGAFIQYNVWRGFFTRARIEVLHRIMDDVNANPIPKNPSNLNEGFYLPKIQRTIPALLVGVGYNLLQSRNFFFPLMVSYNVLHPFTPESQRIYSIYPRGVVVQLGFVNIF